MNPIRRINPKGYTLIEMAIATAVLGFMAATVIVSNRFINLQTVNNSDQTFATEKAIQMYEELRSLVSGNEQVGAGVLDQYGNGNAYDFVLTTDKTVDTGLASANPADPLSGNIMTSGHWRYVRQILVNRVANDTYARQVSVKVYKFPGTNASTTTPTAGVLLATVGGILRTEVVNFQPSQVMDVYILQINNIPAWWAMISTLDMGMQNTLQDIQERNPGLYIRPHYVTRTSYGRDHYYQPAINSINYNPASAPISWVYFYPGYTVQNNGSAVTNAYYDPDDDLNSIRLTGNVMVDGASVPVSTSQFNNSSPAAQISYSVADQYNNAMRYPDEMATYQAVTAAAVACATTQYGVTVNEGVTEISERMLIENMLSQPASFANSIIVNLHGELVPLPPIRNYSDPAKDPGNQLGNTNVTGGPATCYITSPTTGNTNVRVVTHPELLYYPEPVTTVNAVTVRLRVYAYYDSEDEGGSTGLPSGDPRVPYISLFFPDAPVTLVGVTAEIGNGLSSGATCKYNRVAMASPYTGNVAGDVTASGASGPMDITSSYLGPNNNQTLIELYNTPLRAAQGPSAIAGSGSATFGGLNSGDMLYGCEYIPCSPDVTSGPTSATYVNNTYTFTNQDLASPSSSSAGNPNNTARWIISVAMPVSVAFTSPISIYSGNYANGTTIVGIHAIETYLGNGVTTIPTYTSAGVTYKIWPDQSRTYVWCGPNNPPPYTEQYQFIGDPRDCPYLDTKVGGLAVTNAAVTIAANSYNWWFKNGNSMTGYTGFNASGSNNAWNSGGGDGGVVAWDGSSYYNVGVDIPRYWQLIRQGLLSSTSIWTTTNGWGWYYYGMGGEVGFDQSPMSGGISMLSYPFQKTTAGVGTYGYDSINEDGRTGASGVTGLWVAANVSSSSKWYERAWLGELYPDASYLNSWVTYGNLPTCVNHSGTLPQTFYCETYNEVPQGTSQTLNEGFSGLAFYPKPGPYGCSSFFDGVQNGGTSFLQTDGSGAVTGTEYNLGVTTYNIYQYALPYNVNAERPWYFSSSNSANIPEWNLSPYSSIRTSLSIPSTLTDQVDTTSRLYYSDDSNSAENTSGVIRMTYNGSTTQVGYVIETGTSPSGDVGTATLAETDLIYALRTFLDGGEMSAPGSPGHITQIPLIKIFPNTSTPQYVDSGSIGVTIASPVTYTSTSGSVSVGSPVTNIWWRFPGDTATLANYYTEEYPYAATTIIGGVTYVPSNSMTLSSGLYQETNATVVYNLKYSPNSGKSWYNVSDNSSAVSGIYDSGHSFSGPAPWGYSWSINQTTFPQGDYWLMVEAYRQGFANHYAFDIYDCEIIW